MDAPLRSGLALPRRLSLVAQTVQSLSDGIRSGHWQTHLPGERELCALLQLSRPTLRAALEELERKGWLEGSPRRCWRIKVGSVTGGGSTSKGVVGVLLPATFLAMSPVSAFVIDAVRDTLVKAGCLPELHVNQACFSERPAQALERLVHDHPAVVWLVLSSRDPMQHWFVRRRVPCLVMGSPRPQIAVPSVDIDYHAACRHAGGLLLRKGHRHIALVLPQGAYGGDIDSEQGVRQALAVRPDAHLRVLRHDESTAHLSFLLDEVFRAKNPPTAFLVARGLHVLTVMTYLMRRGKRIPQDVALISRDNDPFLQAVTPALARYTFNLTQFARRVSMALRQMVETGALEPKAIRLIPKFLPGETA